jgi:VWFA-related protein
MRPALAAVIGMCALTVATGAQFRSAAETVTVDVLVTNGRVPVTGLTLGDFALTDNGTPQQIDQLYVEELPLNILMVLDTSSSVVGERLQALKAGALAVIDRLRPRDRALVVSFTHRLDLRAALTSDRKTLREAVNGLQAEGGTALRDGAFAALALRAADHRRTLIILFSDGLDTTSILGESRVLDIARRSDAIVYAIGIRDVDSGSAAPIDHGFLTRLTQETAGRLLWAERNRDIEQTFARALEEFNARYVLGYSPRGVPGRGWHRLEVRVKRGNATVLARRGYFAQ